MKKYVKDMTEGNPTGLILSFMMPMLIGNIFQQLYNMVDSMIVGKYVGADALASGYALYTYLHAHDKKVSLIYGGKNRIRKSNLVLMIQELGIPVKYCEHMEAPELLVTIDCR